LPDDELWRLDATALAERVRARELSPVEVVEAFLDRIDRVEPAVGAFTVVLREEALAEARAAPTGPLQGVPVALKDITATAGVPTTLGSRLFADRVPVADSVVAERTRRAGGIVIGKTRMSELTHSAHTTGTANPWSPVHSAGGSSGGSAAAVAAGLAPVADATDGGGSIRIPASCCGCFGLKPHFGRIPSGVYETSFDPFTTLGPITWTVRDAALLLSVWAGPDDRDPLSLPLDVDGAPAGTRIAYTDFGVDVDPEVDGVMRRALTTLEELGFQVEPVELPGFEDAERAWSAIYWSMFAALYGRYLPERAELMSPAVRAIVERGSEISAVDYHLAEIARSRFCERVAGILATHSFLVTPTLSVPPPLAADIESGKLAPEDGRDPQLGWYLTWPFNLTMHPAASIPAGRTAAGLPVGLQAVGPRFGEQDLLRLAAAFETARPWHDRPAL
jgi:Asp-tRNA(Asn)/Glu-tRNA(Gln) amidotransferase A subunit family amidase